jgi:hypothetical protein
MKRPFLEEPGIMATTKRQNVNSTESQITQKRKETATSVPIRVRQKSKVKLEQLLKQANKDRLVRKIRADDLIWCGLNLINDNHIAEICDSSLSNKDRMEVLFQQFSKERRGATREEFLGMLLEGKMTI